MNGSLEMDNSEEKKIYNLLSSSRNKKTRKKNCTLFKLLPVSCRVLMLDEPREHKEPRRFACGKKKMHRNIHYKHETDKCRGAVAAITLGKIMHAVHGSAFGIMNM